MENEIFYFFSILGFVLIFGIFSGMLSGFLFFQADEAWISRLTIYLSGGGYIGIFLWIYKFDRIGDILFLPLFTVSIVTVFFSFIATIFILATRLKKIEGLAKITFIDILLGKQRAINDYFNVKKLEIDKIYNISELKKREEEVEEKVHILYEQRINLNLEKETLNKQKEKILTISLPINNNEIVNEAFIKAIPRFVKHVITFSHLLRESRQEYSKKRKLKGKKALIHLRGFLIQLCKYTSTTLSNSDSDDIRTHIRILHGNVYKAFVCTQGRKEYTYEITEIPFNNGMISEAIEQNCSLIKSLNLESHYPGNNDRTWIDYISFILEDIKCLETGLPLLSMGISIKDDNYDKNIFKLLNYCKIEQIIQSEIKKFDDKFNIPKIINNNYNDIG